MQTKIHGTARAHATLSIYGNGGELLGTTTADNDGRYSVTLDLPAGKNSLRAVADHDGARHQSCVLDYTVEGDDLDCSLSTEVADEVSPETREQALKLAWRFAHNMAAGYDVDSNAIIETVQLAGHTVSDFIETVEAIRMGQ